MGMIYILIPLSLALVGVAVWAFLWAVNSGQFDDLDTPGWDMLSDGDNMRNSKRDRACAASEATMQIHADA